MAVKYSLSYEDVPVEILDRQVRRLRNKEVASVKVLWRSQSVEGATWEVKASMKSNVFACSWNSVELEIQFLVFSGRWHSRTPSTVHPTGPWFVIVNFPRTLSENLVKSRLTDRLTVRGLCPWIESSVTQPLTQTTVDQLGPSFDSRSVGGTHGHYPRTIDGLTVRPAGGGVMVQNGAESSLVVGVKEMQDSDPILLELKGAVHNQRLEVKELNLCQRRWIEFLKDYDMNVLYHLGKANAVSDALNRLSMGRVAHVEKDKKELANDVHRLAPLGFYLINISDDGVIVQNG
ncbi:hypothetical protein MTR67_023184 [Solanum verrucosum]|uniref:Uncharacterized protein n=1 Tax=Solanum verrucosum TaxID=315347 RepID=A0AAF0TRY9_SOLVR|nr:hypothetical protein MTR67_023184 [Solanum verrucosum]